MLVPMDGLDGHRERIGGGPRVVVPDGRYGSAMAATFYELRISLVGAKPPVWRRVRVNPDRSLGHLHRVIQSAMGWGDDHPHQFELKRKGSLPRRFHQQDGDLDFDSDSDSDSEGDEEEVTLRKICPREKDTLGYLYDFGDSWQHKLTVSKVVEARTGLPVPACLSGKGACPPEECGGVYAHREVLEALADPGHRDHAEQVDLWGDDLDPEAFSLDQADRRLESLRREEPARPADAPTDGAVWEAHLGRINVVALLDSGPPEALELLATHPPGSFPDLWYLAVREADSPEAGGMGFATSLADIERESAAALRVLEERVGDGRSKPARLRINDPRIAGWFPGLERAGVEIEVVADEGNARLLDLSVRGMLLKQLLGIDGASGDDAEDDDRSELSFGPPMVAGEGVQDADVQAFHEAAAAFARAAPWRWFPRDAFVEVVRPKPPQGMKLFSIHRDRNGSVALNFLNGAARAKAISAEQDDESLLGHLGDGLWAIDFLPLEDALPDDLDEFERLGLEAFEVDGTASHATLIQLTPTGVRRASRQRLRFATALLHALALQAGQVVQTPTGTHVPLEVDDVPGARGGRFEFRPAQIG